MTPTERLSLLADALEADAVNPQGLTFDMHGWASIRDYGDTWGAEPLTISCNTQGCAVGLAMLMPEFQAEGLAPSSKTNRAFPTLNGNVEADPFDNIMEFFGLTRVEALYLFEKSSYLPVTKGSACELEVAKRIRALVEKKGVQA